MTDQTKPADGSDTLFRDSKFGVLATGAVTLVVGALVNGALDTLTNLDTSGWSGWWTALATAGVATAVGLLTAYKAKRNKATHA